MSNRLAAIAGYRRQIMEACETGAPHEVERHLARTDLFYLLCVILNRPDVNRDWLFDRCREVETSPDGHLDLWFRDGYKSTILTFGKTIQDILASPERTFGFFSFNRPIAKQFLRQIKREFEANERLRELFPDIIWANPQREAPKWSEDDGIIVKRRGNPKESTIEAWGLVDGQPTSKHFNTIVYDDAVTSESITTPDMIEKVRGAWETSLSLLAEGGVRRYIGTRWHYNDLYKTLIERGAAAERRHAATHDGTADGNPVFLSEESLIEKRRLMGPYTFGSQMLLDPTADRAQGFKGDWLRYYTTKGEPDAGMNVYILVDPASSKKRYSDFTAMGAIGLSADGNYYVLDLIRDRLNLPERGDALFALHRRWKPRAVGYERYGMMGDVEYLKDRMGRENYRFEIIELGGQLPKPDRIKRLIPLFEGGRFYLPETLGKVDWEGKYVDLVQSFLNEEYHAFPVAIHDDMLDMLSRICDPAMPLIWPRAAVKEDRYTRRRRDRRGAISWQAA